MNFCARCNKPLKGSFDTIDNPSPTGPGATIYVCPVWCKPAPSPTGPSYPIRRH